MQSSESEISPRRRCYLGHHLIFTTQFLTLQGGLLIVSWGYCEVSRQSRKHWLCLEKAN